MIKSYKQYVKDLSVASTDVGAFIKKHPNIVYVDNSYPIIGFLHVDGISTANKLANIAHTLVEILEDDSYLVTNEPRTITNLIGSDEQMLACFIEATYQPPLRGSMLNNISKGLQKLKSAQGTADLKFKIVADYCTLLTDHIINCEDY